jgi:hypothetical protein
MILPEFCCFSVPWTRSGLKIADLKRSFRPARAFGRFGLILLTLSLTACASDAPSGFEPAGVGGESRKIVQDPQRDQELRESMQRVQLAAEHYASDHGSDGYPLTIDDQFKSYFPGGIEGKRPAPIGPVNVYTGVNEFPSLGKIVTVQASRLGGRFPMAPGKIIYAPVDNGQAYAIMGGAGDGLVLMDDKNPGQVLVLTNLE